MGMDVSGRNAKSESGEYFRASIWSWPLIHSLIKELCFDLLDEKTLEELAFNNGAGADEETCIEMVVRFKAYLSLMDDKVFRIEVPKDSDPIPTETNDSCKFAIDMSKKLFGSFSVDGSGKVVDDEHPEAQSPFKIDREHLTQWIGFLEECGGFEVW